MIGQTKLFAQVDRFMESEFPRFIILQGSKGSGKKLVSQEISKKLGFPLVSVGTSVEDIREMINNSYTNTEPIMYVIPDTDKMSLQAKNALLKVTEEPPQKSYFIMTVTDLSNTLQTLISRACVLKMNPYSVEDLKEYFTSKHPNNINCDFVVSVSSTPLDIDTLMTYDVSDFEHYINTICDHLHTVSSANSFKIEQKLALKKDEDKWDVLLTLQAMQSGYFKRFMQLQDIEYFKCFSLTSKAIQDIKNKNSVNKQYSLDELILEIRKVWK